MLVACPHCATDNSVLRVVTQWSGVHVRCRSCRRLIRVVDSVGAPFVITAVFAAVYLIGFWAMVYLVPPPEIDAPYAAAVFTAAPPVAPAMIAGLLILGLLRRRDATAEPLPRGVFVGAWLAAIAAMLGILALGAFAIVVFRYAEPLDEARFPDQVIESVAIEPEAATAFTFVDLQGRARNLEQLRGRPVFVHLFGVLDPATATGLESVRRLRRDVEDFAVFVIGTRTTPAELTKLASRGPALPYVRLTGPLPGELAGASVSPATFVLDADLRRVFAEEGVHRWDTDACRNFLRQLTPRSR